MTQHKDEHLQSAVHAAAAEFINRESNRRSLITVTHVELRDRGKNARIFISVFPPEQTAAAIDFLSRQKDEFRTYLRQQIRSRTLPACSFLPDPNMGSIQES